MIKELEFFFAESGSFLKVVLPLFNVKKNII